MENFVFRVVKVLKKLIKYHVALKVQSSVW